MIAVENDQYIPKAKFRNNSYEHRRNIWRRNVKRKINFGLPVPDLKVFNDSTLTYTVVKSSWIKRLLAWFKKLFK